MKSKKGPLGTPLGNPLKYFNDQKAARSIPKAVKGTMIKVPMPNLEPLPPTGPQDAPTIPQDAPTGPKYEIYRRLPFIKIKTNKNAE